MRSLTVAGALLVVALMSLEGSRGAFNASTSNSGNRLVAGTVMIGDDDAGSAMFDLWAMVPLVTVERCVNVTYTGSVPADVRLFVSTAGSGLGAYLDTVIEVGTGAAGGAAFGCEGFNPTSVLRHDNLDTFASQNADYATGLGGFNEATTAATRSYRMTVSVVDDNAAQGLAVSATLTWEARSV